MSALICVDSGSCGLKHSRYNLKYGVSAKAPRQENEKTASKQKNRQLKTLKINFFNLIITRNTEKTLKIIIIFIKTIKKRVNALKCRVNDAFRNNDNKKNNDKNIIKIIQSEIKIIV
jgi:hypothetical protein